MRAILLTFTVIIGIGCGTASSVSDVVIEATVEARVKATVESIPNLPILLPTEVRDSAYGPSFQWESSGNARTNTFTITKPEFSVAWMWLSPDRFAPDIRVRIKRVHDNTEAAPVFFSGDNLSSGVISVQERGEFYIEVISTGEWLVHMGEIDEAISR